MNLARRLVPLLTLSCVATASVAQVDLNANPVDPLQIDGGKVTVLVFVRTDCPISNRYAPVIQRLSSRYAAKVAFWLVYPNPRESAKLIQSHVRDYGYKLPVLRDPQHVLVKRSQVQVTPEAAVFDGKGQLLYHGRIDNWYRDFGRAQRAPTTHELDDAIQAALGGQPPATSATRGVGCYIADLE